jgi:hypothetical protein
LNCCSFLKCDSCCIDPMMSNLKERGYGKARLLKYLSPLRRLQAQAALSELVLPLLC